jgi:hypothetical protein
MERTDQADLKAPTLGMISKALGTNEILANLSTQNFKYYHFKDQNMFNLTQQDAFSQLIHRADYHGTRDRICIEERIGKDEDCSMIALLDASKGSQQPICAVTKDILTINPYGSI